MAWSFCQLHAIFLPISLTNRGQIINRTNTTEFHEMIFLAKICAYMKAYFVSVFIIRELKQILGN